MRLYSVRGATGCDNSPESITKSVGELCGTLFSLNKITSEDIVNIQFTVTPDLTALNPATAFRRAPLSVDTGAIPLFCSAEPVVEGMKKGLVRIMVTYYSEQPPKGAVYINGAEVLRPDLVAKGEK